MYIPNDRLPEDKLLNDATINNPLNQDDLLPMPYCLIDEVLQETIILQLNLKMHEIEEKKKNPNYEGGVKEYLAHNTMDL